MRRLYKKWFKSHPVKPNQTLKERWLLALQDPGWWILLMSIIAIVSYATIIGD